MPDARSRVNDVPEEPVADPEPVVKANDEPEPVEQETTTQEQAGTTTEDQETTTEEQETTTEEQDETPAVTEPHQPEVRGPIEFDSREPQPNTSADDQDDASDNQTSPDPSPTGADGQDDQNDGQDAAA